MSKGPKYTFEDVERTLTFHRDRLLSYQNVLHLCVGEKVKNGCGKKRLAIRVYVSKKEKESTIKFVPKRLQAIHINGSKEKFFITTDVEEISELSLMGIKGGDGIKGRMLGSVSFVYENEAGNARILTNCHVALGFDKQAKQQQIWDEHGIKIGRVIDATTLSTTTGEAHTCDAAIINPTVDVELLKIDGFDLPFGGYDRIKNMPAGGVFYYKPYFGMRRTCKYPNPFTEPRAINTVEGGPTIEFKNFIELEITSGNTIEPGHSGSALFGVSQKRIIFYGLVFAGDTDKRKVAVFDILDVFSALGN